jgi:CheY-like chemotaxis protein
MVFVSGTVQSSPHNRRRRTGNSLRILVVDDHAFYLPLVSNWLQMLRGIVSVEVASDPAEALAMLEQLKPDLVLSDVQMPGMNGFELTRQLKARAAPPVVVLMTGLESDEFREAARDAGADLFLEKSRLHKLLPKFLTERFGVGGAPA